MGAIDLPLPDTLLRSILGGPGRAGDDRPGLRYIDRHLRLVLRHRAAALPVSKRRGGADALWRRGDLVLHGLPDLLVPDRFWPLTGFGGGHRQSGLPALPDHHDDVGRTLAALWQMG